MTPTKTQRGRPKTDLNIQRIELLNTAMSVLVRLGYQKATTLAIAKACGISKQTLYNHFPSKEALFIALIENRTVAMNNLLATALDDTTLNLEGVLKHFGRLVLGVLTSDVSVAINRACIMAAGSGDLALSKAYFKFGQEPVRQKLIAVLERAGKDGLIVFDDVNDPFQVLLGLHYGDFQVRRLLGVASAPDEKQIADKVENAIAHFMKLFTP